MRSLYRIFDRYLPRDNYNQEPILYLTNGTYVIYAYSFDRKKEVVLTSDIDKRNFRYMSIFEIFQMAWKIIHLDDVKRILNNDFDYNELLF